MSEYFTFDVFGRRPGWQHMPNPKIPGRQALLAAHPELRRRVRLEPLREIIDFVDFRCARRCSIARDEAIPGSDIDAGLVITREPTTFEQQLAFLAELRLQGFTVSHPQEVADAEAVRDTTSVLGPGGRNYEWDVLNHRHTELFFSCIDFWTKADMQTPDHTRELILTYNANYSIPDHTT